MKHSKLIVTLLLALFSLSAFAQTKTDSIKKPPAASVKSELTKPEYHPDPARIYHITLDISAPEIFGITSALDGTLHKSNQISAAEADDHDNDNKSFAKLIKLQAANQAQDDYKKWQADTAAKAKIPIHKNLINK